MHVVLRWCRVVLFLPVGMLEFFDIAKFLWFSLRYCRVLVSHREVLSTISESFGCIILLWQASKYSSAGELSSVLCGKLALVVGNVALSYR